MKRKLFLFVAAMCCLATSVWGVTEKTETITCNGSSMVTGESGIRVISTSCSSDSWNVNASNSLIVMPGNLVITKIAINGEYSSITCTQLTQKSANTWWQNGAYNHYNQITFTSSSAQVSSLDITYHKHGWEDCVTHHEAKVPSCTENANDEYWECDCGLIFSDGTCTDVLAEIPMIPALDHDLTYVEHKNPTLASDGTLSHWHCERCGRNYQEEAAVYEINGSTVLPRWEADALLVASSTVDDSYLAEEEATVTFTGVNTLNLTIGEESHEYALDEDEPLVIDFSHTMKLTANQDPDHAENCYATFYTSECAYRVPEVAKAYIGKVQDEVLSMTSAGSIIHTGEAVILKATQMEITLMPSASKD